MSAQHKPRETGRNSSLAETHDGHRQHVRHVVLHEDASELCHGWNVALIHANHDHLTTVNTKQPLQTRTFPCTLCGTTREPYHLHHGRYHRVAARPALA
jgi:hypothetical protein